MALTYAVINQKGGVGKSTTAMALGSCFSMLGLRVLLADLDAQGNLSYTLDAASDTKTVLDALNGFPSRECVTHAWGFDVIPSSPGLAAADIMFNSTGKEYRLREALTPLQNEYDYIILDTPPALGILTVNALTAADGSIIPAQADIYSLQGIGQLHSTIDAVRRYTNPSLAVTGILLTRYNPRAVLSRDMTELLEETALNLGTRVFNAKIRETVAVREAQASKQSLLLWAPKSTAALDYLDLAREILEGRNFQ